MLGKKTMKKILIAAAALSLGHWVTGATVHAAEPEALPESAVEIFRIAPGQHEAFLKLIADTEAAKVKVGMPPDQLYIHEDGASWDFILIKAKGQDPAKWKQVEDILHAQGHPSGPDYFFMIRKMIAEHTDTTAIGPTTATAYLATRKTK
jgi:hypothetical protein